ncbi:histone acetyltransferase of the CBP family 12 [Rhynchospora pubera]|uniref:histone acetyltransferase n=1 Tax=Rhynchospora pubera TaxID=906938 RepID=A0AAV8DQZ0_9POAL|nr:histone acetyltransferase of the CBP family 12 [Rhynchospora pubera]
MQYFDPGNAQLRLPSLYCGPPFMTHHHSYASVQSSSFIAHPSTSSSVAASSSGPNNFKECLTEAANSQLKGNVLLRQDSGASTTATEGVMHHRDGLAGTSNAIREVGLLPDDPNRDAVSRASFSPSLNSNKKELNPLGNVPEISSQMSTSCNHASPTITSSYPSQQPHSFRVNQSVEQQNARSILVKKQQQLLLGYNHAMVCRKKETCGIPQCPKLKEELEHAAHCDGVSCTRARNCSPTQKMIRHFKACHDLRCPVCGPVKEFISRRSTRINDSESKRQDFPASDEPGPKRVKTDQSDRMFCDISNDLKKEPEAKVVSDGESAKEFRVESVTNSELDCSANEAKKEPKLTLVKNINSFVNHGGDKTPKSATDELLAEEADLKTVTPVFVNESNNEASIEHVEPVKDSDPLNSILENGTKIELAKNLDTSADEAVKKATKQRVRGASLLDTFTPEEISIHLNTIRVCEKKTKATNEHLQLLDQVEDQNMCSLCGKGELLFAPPPRYCGKCAGLIASHGVFYCTGETENKDRELPNSVPISLCSKCYNVSGEVIKLQSGDVPKLYFEKRSNYAETDADSEWWVQCSKCEAWQHQVCALFNGRRNQANLEYMCVNCFLKEIENGQCESQAPIKVLGACDLPRTRLSDHIEKWLFTHLEIEREERATNSGKTIEEVPGVEGLCVRVVSSIDRVAYVKQNFKQFLKEENYPSQFPYKSKAIVLFQKIEGVDVCLFAMYVQEYGSQCAFPNQRHTYISYIDSVKYFQPEIKSSTGEALRTFVYHGILIGYLDYCKKRGFTSCSLWACPPTKHDDYILYCHPACQKMPKAEKLRIWYQAMITKALKEKVVVERTNLYDYYLIPTNDWKTNVSAAHLPYCDNDFWPGEAEFILSNKEKSGPQKKENEPKGRAMRAAKRGLMDGKPDDIMLLHKLGERMRSMKEDFILIYLQPTCKHCRRAIVSGRRWVCTSCKNFLLCDKCYSEEEELPPKDKHPTSSKLKHEFQKVLEPALPSTDDPDPCKECEFFDSRIDLLRLCQNKMYQFDTLRRAKHSTMMILHHLHTPWCSTCHNELEPDISWCCATCPGFYMCSSCYSRGVWEFAHDHELVKLREMVTNTGTGSHTGNTKGNRKFTLKELALATMVHTSRCIIPRCEHRLCRKMKLLFRHGVRCKIHQRGGCLICSKIWRLMQLHCESCHDSDCKIARCKEIKDHISKLRLHLGS